MFLLTRRRAKQQLVRSFERVLLLASDGKAGVAYVDMDRERQTITLYLSRI